MSHSKSTRRDFLGRTWQITLGANPGLVGLTQAGCSRETAPERTEPAPKEPLATEWLGGRKVTPEELKQIHKSLYMLHVECGELSKVPVEKNLLPHDPEGHAQGIEVAQGPEGTIYVKQRTLWCKSEDRGKTWTGYHRDENLEESTFRFITLSNGRLLCIPRSASGKRTDPVEIHASDDEGRSWNHVGLGTLP